MALSCARGGSVWTHSVKVWLNIGAAAQEGVKSPSLGAFKKQLDKALSAMV